jgi:F1F0 ATPase subunit 2
VIIQGLKALLFLVLGAAAGGAYLGALGWNVRLYCAATAVLLALSIHLLRLLAIVIVFVAIAHAGAPALLWSFAGFHVTRLSSLRLKLLPFETVP